MVCAYIIVSLGRSFNDKKDKKCHNMLALFLCKNYYSGVTLILKFHFSRVGQNGQSKTQIQV